jgi:hypothetical protein
MKVRGTDRHVARYVLLVVVAGAELAILQAPRHGVGSTLLVLLAAGVGALLVYSEHRRPALRLAPTAAAIGLVVVVSIVAPPRTSNDVWSYAMYGRMVTVHGSSPYEHVPADFRSDPFLQRVSPRWRHRASVYGPLFVGIAATGTWMAGDSLWLSRLYFQILAALALLAMLTLVWRTTRRVAPLIFLGLNPVLAVVVVNGGHNDAWVGLAMLMATLLAFRRRGIAVGIVIGLAMLVKVTAVLALLGVLFWAWRNHLRRFAVLTAGTTGFVVLMGYLPVLVSASHVLGGADRTVTNASAWNALVDRILHHDSWRSVSRPLAPNDTLTIVFYLSIFTVLVLASSLAWLAAKDRRSEPAVGVSLAAFPIAAEYALPWYSAWALPVFAAADLTPVAAIVWAESVLMLAALKLPIAVTGGGIQSVLRVALTQIAPPVMLVAFVVVAIRQYRVADPPRQRGRVVTGAVGAVDAVDPSGGALTACPPSSHPATGAQQTL